MSIVCVFQGVQWITALKCLFGNLEIPWVELLDIGDRRPNHVFSYLSHLAVLCNMPNSCPLFKICKAYADLWLLYFVYLQCSLYCFVRSVPVCPTFARFRCNVSICRWHFVLFRRRFFVVPNYTELVDLKVTRKGMSLKILVLSLRLDYENWTWHLSKGYQR
jgi:hypothetical protein